MIFGAFFDVGNFQQSRQSEVPCGHLEPRKQIGRFEQCDNALRQLLLQQNIPDEMEDLYKILLSAEMLAQDSSTTILETYSIYTVDDIRTRLKKLDSLLELNSDFNYTITTDENDIRQRKRVDLMGLLMIHENLNYFSRLYKN